MSYKLIKNLTKLWGTKKESGIIVQDENRTSLMQLDLLQSPYKLTVIRSDSENFVTQPAFNELSVAPFLGADASGMMHKIRVTKTIDLTAPYNISPGIPWIFFYDLDLDSFRYCAVVLEIFSISELSDDGKIRFSVNLGKSWQGLTECRVIPVCCIHGGNFSTMANIYVFPFCQTQLQNDRPMFGDFETLQNLTYNVTNLIPFDGIVRYKAPVGGILQLGSGHALAYASIAAEEHIVFVKKGWNVKALVQAPTVFTLERQETNFKYYHLT